MVPPRAVVPDPAPALRTAGCSGAAGFLRCVVTKTAAATVAPIVTAVATALRMNSRIAQTATGAFKKETRSKVEPRILLASAPRWPLKISWYTDRKSTAYFRLPVPSRSVRLGSAP